MDPSSQLASQIRPRPPRNPLPGHRYQRAAHTRWLRDALTARSGGLESRAYGDPEGIGDRIGQADHRLAWNLALEGGGRISARIDKPIRTRRYIETAFPWIIHPANRLFGENRR